MKYQNLSHLSKQTLLKTKIKNFDLSFEKSFYVDLLINLHLELKRKDLLIRPKIWASDEWFCPDGHTSFAIPFTLLDSRFLELEKEFGLKTEGQEANDFMKLARHECGHIIDNAYNLRNLTGRSDVFGDLNVPYPIDYTFKKHSKKYVKHLTENYAQAHPEEDWAETFAVWLDSHSQWREKYRDWPAFEKLLFLNKTMNSLKNVKPKINQKAIDPYTNFEITLGDYFKLKKQNQIRNFNKLGIKEFITNGKGHEDLYLGLVKHKKQIIENINKKTKFKKYDLTYAIEDLELNAKKKGLKIIKVKNKMKTLNEIALIYSSKFLKEGKHRILM